MFYLRINKKTNVIESVSCEPLEENDDAYSFLIEENIFDFCNNRPGLTDGGYFLLNNEIVENVEETQKCLINREQKRLRELRESECFTVINRGQLWYASLTSVQIQELTNWYQAWLDVTETLTAPTRLDWLDTKTA